MKYKINKIIRTFPEMQEMNHKLTQTKRTCGRRNICGKIFGSCQKLVGGREIERRTGMSPYIHPPFRTASPQVDGSERNRRKGGGLDLSWCSGIFSVELQYLFRCMYLSSICILKLFAHFLFYCRTLYVQCNFNYYTPPKLN